MWWHRYSGGIWRFATWDVVQGQVANLAYKWGEAGLNTYKGDFGLNEETFSVFSGKQYIILQVSAEGSFFHLVKNMS